MPICSMTSISRSLNLWLGSLRCFPIGLLAILRFQSDLRLFNLKWKVFSVPMCCLPHFWHFIRYIIFLVLQWAVAHARKFPCRCTGKPYTHFYMGAGLTMRSSALTSTFVALFWWLSIALTNRSFRFLRRLYATMGELDIVFSAGLNSLQDD